jgi:4-hydroxybenzoate polyprenyltransferase
VVIAIAATCIAFAVDWRTAVVLAGYLAVMQAYTFFLKHEVILDVMAIAAGFVLRAMAGAYAIDVPISPWLYVVTGLGALFLAITKRRAEVELLQEDAIDHRRTLEHYTVAFVDQMTAMVTASTVIAYALYTFTAPNLPANHAMMLTIPFVVYGIFRYLFLSLTRNEGGSPEEVLLKDVPLLLTVVGWVVMSMAVLSAYR